jgi:FkbM family methyltransferase
MLSPYGFSPIKDRWFNAQSAGNTIQLLHELGITPKTLVDVGANNSQWAVWIKKHWLGIWVISFEPHPDFKPIGSVHRAALADKSGMARFASNGQESCISPAGQISVPVWRFDSLPLKFDRPAILKVDAENFTYQALLGFGHRLEEFDVVVVEMWNSAGRKDQQADIWKLMLENGKTRCRMVDAVWTAGHGIPSYDAAFYSPR